MGFLQPHGGYRRCDGQAAIEPVIIHGLADAHAAIDAARSAGQTIDLITAPAASSYIGAAMFKTITDEARRYGGDCIGSIYYDCGISRGHVLAALRTGLKQLCLDAMALTPALIDLAAQHDATLVSRATLIKS